MKPYYVHPPVFKIVKIMVSKTVVRVIVDQVGMKRMYFVYHINSVVHCISIVLVNEERVVWVYPYT